MKINKRKKIKNDSMGLWILGSAMCWRIVKTKGIDLGLGYGLVWLVFEIKKVGFFCFKKKRKKGRELESGRTEEKESSGELWRISLSPEAIWMAKWCPFRPKFWESVLLNERNNSTVDDRDFNGQILRSVVWETNSKTLIKCIFHWKKSINLVIMS